MITLYKELDENTIVEISNKKGEPEWMKEFRIASLKKFFELGMPRFGPTLDIDFSSINYYKKTQENVSTWDKVNCSIRNTFDKLGVIDAEKKYLDGVTNQYESEVIYHKLDKELEEKGIVFSSTDDALKSHPELFYKYFNNLVKYDENKFTALNGALWSGGSFIYIPPHTKLDRPLQSYFRIDSMALGQFERTIIIVDDYSELSYIEGCTAMSYSVNSLHAGVVEIYVGKGARVRYSTIQNWSKDVYNLVTKRAIVEDGGLMEWVDGNVGSGVTMKYPSCILKGNGARGNSISIAYAKSGQVLDAGAKMIHIGKNTKSKIVSKSIAAEGGIANYRGEVKINKSATGAESIVKCDTLIMDEQSKSDTYPLNIVSNKESTLEHEASVSKISEDKLFYLMCKGLNEEQAKELIIAGFVDDFKKELPMEYAVELNRLLNEI